MEITLRSGALRSACGRQKTTSNLVQPFRSGNPVTSVAVRRRKAHVSFTSLNSSEETRILTRSPEETQVSSSDSLWHDGRSLVVALPISEPHMAESSIDQVLLHPDILTERPGAPEKVQQQPGLLRRFWRTYIRALDQNPILVKSATSFFGFLIGDLLAQCIVGHSFDLFRCLRLLAFGVTMDGPVGHFWYTFLDKNVYPQQPTSNRAVVLKMVLDQIVWAPFFSCIFFAFTNTLAGHPGATIPAIQNKLVPMMLANFAVWPIAHLINFKFIPSQQRILYINCVQIAWSAYLSNLSAARVRTR